MRGSTVLSSSWLAASYLLVWRASYPPGVIYTALLLRQSVLRCPQSLHGDGRDAPSTLQLHLNICLSPSSPLSYCCIVPPMRLACASTGTTQQRYHVATVVVVYSRSLTRSLPSHLAKRIVRRTGENRCPLRSRGTPAYKSMPHYPAPANGAPAHSSVVHEGNIALGTILACSATAQLGACPSRFRAACVLATSSSAHIDR